MFPLLLALSAAAVAQEGPPHLVVVIAVDQLSADLYATWRPHLDGGFKRLAEGVVFPSGYQSHAGTETCPGHATILTGTRPGRNGIIANDWYDLSLPRDDKLVYCAEDPSQPGTDHRNYVPSLVQLKVPTAGERLKAVSPQSQVVSVSGKDRAAMMLAGKGADQVWWWDKAVLGFSTWKGSTAPVPAAVGKANASAAATLKKATRPLKLPAACAGVDREVPITDTVSVGRGRFDRAANDVRGFEASPELDVATLDLAAGLVTELGLGRDTVPDLLAVSLSATDKVGHRYGTDGTEMCLQLLALDEALGRFFTRLDQQGLAYAVVLTADHGGLDLPERQHDAAMPDAHRLDAMLDPTVVGEAIAAQLGVPGPLLYGGRSLDVWVERGLDETLHDAVLAEAERRYAAHPQVAQVFRGTQLAAEPAPTGSPEAWSLLQRARASYDPDRSGDLIFVLKPRITPIVDPSGGYVATHGSPWDYDRRVPIFFWREGSPGFEQPQAVETVDILPTLAAAWLDLEVPADQIDGRCLDLDPGPADTCGE